VTGGFLEFYGHWHGDTERSKEFLNNFPYVLSLKRGKTLLPFYPESTSRNKILVTKAYDDMFHRLLRLRVEDKGTKKGAVIAGQPGVGASF